MYALIRLFPVTVATAAAAVAASNLCSTFSAGTRFIRENRRAWSTRIARLAMQMICKIGRYAKIAHPHLFINAAFICEM